MNQVTTSTPVAGVADPEARPDGREARPGLTEPANKPKVRDFSALTRLAHLYITRRLARGRLLIRQPEHISR